MRQNTADGFNVDKKETPSSIDPCDSPFGAEVWFLDLPVVRKQEEYSLSMYETYPLKV